MLRRNLLLQKVLEKLLYTLREDKFGGTKNGLFHTLFFRRLASVGD